MSERLTIGVEGIENEAVVTDIDKTIRKSFDEMALPGSWRVVVKPSTVSGRWDFRVYGLDVRHTLSIAVPPSLLSSLIPRRLRESLDRSQLAHAGQTPEPTSAYTRATAVRHATPAPDVWARARTV